MKQIKLVVFDMAGTTIRDLGEVENCFFEACQTTGLPAVSRKEINSFMGYPKRFVFEKLWAGQIGDRQHPSFQQNVLGSYDRFREILENHYRTHPVVPTEGAEATFAWLRSQGIRIALTTGFYRKVTDMLLEKLGWTVMDGVIDCSVASDEVSRGRPHPDLIFKAMHLLGISHADQVICIGDTPSDIRSGRAAGCLLSLGVTNGSHAVDELEQEENDGLLASLRDFKPFVQGALHETMRLA